MAWAERLPGGKYAARYRDSSGAIHRATGGPWSHKAEALRHGNDQEAAARLPGWKDPQVGRRHWGDWREEWWKTRHVEESTLTNDLQRLDKYLTPRWADWELADITRHDIKVWVGELREQGLADSTVKRIVSLFSASLHGALDAEILDTNPASNLRLPGTPPSMELYLTRDQAARLLDSLKATADPVHHQLVLFLLATGMRFGEAIALHHERVHRERQHVEVVEAASKHSRVIKPYPKSRRRRIVPLPEWAELPADTGAPSCGLEHSGGVCRSGLVFTTRVGTLVEYAWFQRAFTRAWKAAEIGPVRIHDLRHTYASWLLQGGESLAEVGRLLGHTSPLTTQRYAHLETVDVSGVLASLGRPEHRAEIEQPDAHTRPQMTTGDNIVMLTDRRKPLQSRQLGDT